MKIKPQKFLSSILFFLCLFFIPAFAQSFPLPPPVSLECSTIGTPEAGKNIPITVKVTPQEDMYLDISCFVPQGIMPVYGKGIRIRPHNGQLVVGLWVGPLPGRITREFTFQVTAGGTGSYKLVCAAQALARWGETEEAYTLNVN
jgi:hypothetical protein